MKTKLKVGIAGFGIVGKKRAQCINLNPNLELIAVCDKDPINHLSDKKIKSFFSYKELLKEDIDILFVCMSNDMASKVTVDGLLKGLHVFCEKPPARNLSELVAVIKVSKKFPKLKLMYGFNHRYHESIKQALKIINSGMLGHVINIRGVYGKSKLITFDQPDWRTKREISGGGILLDQGIHMLDLIRLFGGEFSEVYSFISNSYWKFNIEDNAYAILKSKQGVVAMLNSSATQWTHRFNLDITLAKGSLILSGILSGSKSYGDETMIVTHNNEIDKNNKLHEVVHKFDSDSSWEEEVNLFTNSVLNNSPIINGSLIDAFKTLKLVYKVYYADKHWRKKFQISNPEKIKI